MHSRSFLAITAAAVLAAATTVVTAGSSTAIAPPVVQQQGPSSAPSGSFAVSGQEARDFALPSGMRELRTAAYPDGSTQVRYQQMVGDATVFGGQISVVRDSAGTALSVVGAHFPGLEPKNEIKLNKGQARKVAEDRIGTRGDWRNELRIDPRSGRLFYELQSIRVAQRPVRWVDAGSGEVIKEFSALAHGEGVGVKGDTKQIDTSQNPGTGLFELDSADDRQKTYDAQNSATKNPVVMTDADDVWDLVRGIRSPSQPAGVDAHYYAGLVDDFYLEKFNRDSIDDDGMKIVSVVHYGKGYCNAFWNGAWMTYGDGDGDTCLPLSGGLDVDGHELTHGVTDFTSNLIYENESGALNEAFSDMMGNTIEFYAEDNGLDPAAKPDWLIGEDIILDGTANPGFRNMSDPAEDNDPSHYSLRYTGAEDGGGVHTNSGIANHAYYLAVEGGSNAGCTANAAHGVLLTGPDCAVVVPALGVDRAAQIFYTAFTGLPEFANFCDARNSTVANAGEDAQAIGAAWNAVGVHADCTQGSPPPPPCESNPTATLPIESPHPYGNNGDCTWTYANGSAGFSFHFSMLDLEKDYDYVYVKDADGNTLATYTGAARRAFNSPCIPTASGSIQMVTDPAVTGRGFTVDSVSPC